LSQAAPAYPITAHHLCAFLLYLARWLWWRLSKEKMYLSFIGLRLTKTSLTLIDRTQLWTKGQCADYPQAHVEITSNSFQRRAH
jgi:hypothetical protein